MHLLADIETPALLIDESILNQNLTRMQELADKNRVRLRPHIKTHKMPQLADRQLAGGAVGIAVAKLSEAEIMARHGLGDIQIANQIVGTQKIVRLRNLARQVRISCAVDAPTQVSELSQAFENESRPLDLLIEIDTGLHRCGLEDQAKVIELARHILSLPGVRLAGLMTHAGHAYATAGEPDKLCSIAHEEGQKIVTIAAALRNAGIEVETVSVGSTPTASEVVKVAGVTELRVGNYIFNDMIQVALGVAAIENCALTVLTTVISVPSEDRAVIDAGSKALSLDLGAHGVSSVVGYGRIFDHHGLLGRLSEEHGIITHSGDDFRIGKRLKIIPNHACATVNLYDRAYLVGGGRILSELAIAARGCLT